MRRLNSIIVGAITVAIAIPGFADQDSTHYEWATVLEADPVVRIIRKPVNEEVCWEEEVYQEIPTYRSAVPGILGAVIGGVIGNQFGGGSGQDLMTMAGAAIGGSVAVDNQRRKYPQKYYASLEKRCGINTEWQETQQIVGWDVVYEYQGESYLTRVPDEPGDQIRIRVDIQPAPL